MIRLKYLDTMGVNAVDDLPPQPVLVLGKGNKRPTRVVPITKLADADADTCVGCVAYVSRRRREYDCYSLPDCARAIFVRATPENKIKHIAWRLEQDR